MGVYNLITTLQTEGKSVDEYVKKMSESVNAIVQVDQYTWYMERTFQHGMFLGALDLWVRYMRKVSSSEGGETSVTISYDVNRGFGYYNLRERDYNSNFNVVVDNVIDAPPGTYSFMVPVPIPEDLVGIRVYVTFNGNPAPEDIGDVYLYIDIERK